MTFLLYNRPILPPSPIKLTENHVTLDQNRSEIFTYYFRGNINSKQYKCSKLDGIYMGNNDVFAYKIGRFDPPTLHGSRGGVKHRRIWLKIFVRT